MNPDQRSRTHDFWVNNLSNEIHLRLSELVESDMKNESSDDANRNSVTTFNDLVRLIHLKVDPSAVVLWSEALREKTQLQLDDKEGLGGLKDPYDALASLFNDPSNRYQNACIAPGALDNNGMYVPAQPGMGFLSKTYGMINPSQSGRPARDGSWVRMKWKEVKSTLTIYFQRFTKSGNQDGEDIYDEWVKFLDNGGAGVPLITYYVICALAWHDFNLLNKAIPKEVQIHTSVVDISGEDEVAGYIEEKERSCYKEEIFT